MIHFYLNGQYKQLTDLNPNTTVLEYLRLHERQTDTKEGCGSGDCRSLYGDGAALTF